VRLCANENVPEACVVALRQFGHDVVWIRETAPGSSDADVLARARNEERLLITFDKDFGDLVFHRGLQASQGVVLLRIAQPSAALVAQRVVAILASRTDWLGQYSVVEEHSVRMRPLP
jgi:predicted nuclease of predicted toxin-antitoxin system